MNTANCSLCNKILDPTINEFTGVIYRDRSSYERMCHVCSDCDDTFSRLIGHDNKILHCRECGNLSRIPDYNFTVDMLNFKSRFVTILCSSECHKKSVKRQMQNTELKLKIRCVCGKIEKSMKKCGKCKSIYYCSVECQCDRYGRFEVIICFFQKKDWKDHKHQCMFEKQCK